MEIDGFIKNLDSEKESTLLVMACSGGKRDDGEIELMAGGESLAQSSVHFDKQVNDMLSRYRSCVEELHGDVVNPSEKHPAFLRYSGNFYNSVWEDGGLPLWEEIVKSDWRTVILSAYYGVLKLTDPINDYNLQISKVRARCRNMLPGTLERIMEINSLEKVYFLTSRAYSKPFERKMRGAYRIVMYDSSEEEIQGAYAKDYYRESGHLITSIVSGENPESVSSVELEEI